MSLDFAHILPTTLANAWPYISAALLLVVVGVAILLIGLAYTAHLMHHPPLMSDGRALARLGRLSPADFGWSYADETFEIPDPATGGRLHVAGWFIPAAEASSRTVVLVHSYGDAKVGAIAWAGPWREMGWNVLAIDLRGHGETRLVGSRSITTDAVTAGVRERTEVHAVLNEVTRRRPAEAQTLALMGVSLGGLACCATAIERDDLAALVLESPVIDWPEAAGRFADVAGLPLTSLHGLRMRLSSWLLQADWNTIRLDRTLRHVKCPTLIILPEQDHLVSDPSRQAMLASAEAVGASVHVVAGAGHNMPLVRDPAGWREALAAFLERSEMMTQR